MLTPGVFNSRTSSTRSSPARWASSSSRAATSSSTTTSCPCAPRAGSQRVDVIYRRIDDAFLDPVVFRSDSTLGVPGLMAAARAGNVTIANAVGNGVADDKAVYAYVPDLIRYYLGEEPILPNVDDLPAVGRGPARRTCSSRLDELVVKPVAGVGRLRDADRPGARPTRRSRPCRKRIEADPRGYIAQEVVPLSRHPTLVDDHLEGRHVDLRPVRAVRRARSRSSRAGSPASRCARARSS